MADAIATNSTLKELEYALSSPALLSIPADSACLLPYSLGVNNICWGGNMSGLIALCDMLKTNSSLRELKCVLLAPCARACACACFQISAVSTL